MSEKMNYYLNKTRWLCNLKFKVEFDWPKAAKCLPNWIWKRLGLAALSPRNSLSTDKCSFRP